MPVDRYASYGFKRQRESVARRWGRWALALFYALGGVAHFVFTDAMAAIVPPAIPLPVAVVAITGVIELAGAAMLLPRATRRFAGWGLAAYALCVWPANIYHAMLDLGSDTGLPIWYHAPRLLLQPVIIWWALWGSGAVELRE
ncbi:DoxX family protein [Sphingomonas yunnanensis]|uniref:DoxX family protein n=1 Tax=Sphingomonas yunnanensis TaxID=310400 RepID=UPI001FE8B4CB|nr:hypothetical protein [Sphingomonas yunnanensis]